ncbi:hypothetical protein AB0368_33975 [Actinoplanes sp. NPDC051475]
MSQERPQCALHVGKLGVRDETVFMPRQQICHEAHEILFGQNIRPDCCG